MAFFLLNIAVSKEQRLHFWAGAPPAQPEHPNAFVSPKAARNFPHLRASARAAILILQKHNSEN